MNIVVLVKQVPDTSAERTLSRADHLLDREDADLVLDEINERAAEEALTLKETADAHITVVSMGPDSALDAIRKVLAMGADRAIHICDDRLRGADLLTTATVLAAAVRTVQDVDLVLAGNATTDGQAGAVPAVIAELLGLPQLTQVRQLTVEAGQVSAERETENGEATLKAPLPALVSVTEKINEPRYPSFKGIMAAKKKPVDTVDLDDLFPGADGAGFLVTRTRVVEAVLRPPRSAGIRITDDGSAGRQLVEHLIAQNLV
ncbi:Electron transfer flavoprotein alpha/beta- subunit [Streptomyces lincolnensis]|uniref:Electron transfer flavoprotein subunit beta n=1 Tax=Streptomyces lincolnensis TaxID=1915 RepID=A0A1B1MMD2_STRLN|nr:electron transfer flavoprotein subunit beta/FixA family protein [Streptomyces lincolnensis]ANS69703.1 Electron transfer flavoprotein alpha/beta- subunit [Streptomyces lincolnensis]AXG58622.1 Electron transfer flavoprotein alpha/beta- subunit [Streptomyces lincolnensis]QMV11249.1 electron transfer flavoprotein subunit beta [Streptomyces lincolnensis]